MTTFSLADLWETLCDAGPDAECLVAPPVRHTRRSLDEAANQVTHALAVEPGTRVGIYSRNRTEYVEALLDWWKAGAVPVDINWRYTLDELPYVTDDAELEVMIVEDVYVPMSNNSPSGARFVSASGSVLIRHAPGSTQYAFYSGQPDESDPDAATAGDETDANEAA